MHISATIGYGISVSKAKAVELGYTLDELADAVADALPFMTRISNGDLDSPEETTLIMAVKYSTVTSYDFNAVLPAVPFTSLDTKRELDYFLRHELPSIESGVVLAGAVSA